MPFEDVYTVKTGDNLSKIAREYGFDNPGPIHAYPPNGNQFRARSADLIRPGEQIRIPYHPNMLQKIIATSKHLASEIAQDSNQLMQRESLLNKDIKDFLFKIDAANMLANVGVGIGALVAKGPGATMTGKEALAWLADSRIGLGASVATTAIPNPTAPRKDFKFFVRHTLGPWNPSFWASVYASIDSGDVDVYLYGADATTYKSKLKIKAQADADIAKLNGRCSEARQQMLQLFYKNRI